MARCIYKEGKEAERTLVTAKCRRVGGGFGAKLSRHTPAACAAGVAAVVCRRPVCEFDVWSVVGVMVGFFYTSLSYN